MEQRFQSTYEISFELKATDPKVASLIEDAPFNFRGEEFFITKVKPWRKNEVAMVTIMAEAAYMKLADILRVGSFKLTDMTPRDGLAAILDGTGWSVSEGTTTGDTTTFSLEATDASILDLIYQWAKVTGNEVQFGTLNREIGIGPFVGRILGLSFRYGRNITEIERESTPPAVTRLYPYGRNNLDITSVNGGLAYIEDYSFYTAQGLTLPEAQARYRKDQLWRDDSFIEDTALLAAAETRLALLSQPTVRYTAQVIDLTRLAGVEENYYECGDEVSVYDEILGFDLRARVSRMVRYPLEPHRNVIELTFNPFELPDPNVSTARDSTRSWELFESRNRSTPRWIRQGSQIVHRLRLTTIQDAEWVVGFKFYGVAVGDSLLTIEAQQDEDDTAIWTAYQQEVVDGQIVEFNFTYAEKEIDEGTHTLLIRAYSDTPGAGVNVNEGDTAFWVLARGTTRQNVTLPNSERFDFVQPSGGVQQFTVPDDVTEILIEAHGSAGGSVDGHVGGAGGMVKGKIAVVGGTVYDVYVGGPLWPNGGSGDSNASGNGGSTGGGSSSIVLQGSPFADSIIVAAGGGGSGCGSFSLVPLTGGYGGFLVAGDADPATSVTLPATGATQEAPGLGGNYWDYSGGPWARTGEDGDTDGVGYGGDAGDTVNSFAFPGGGGGGGWHGGGGAGHAAVAGAYAGGGGGGSGWASGEVYDLETLDNSNSDNGYLIISWETPDNPDLEAP